MHWILTQINETSSLGNESMVEWLGNCFLKPFSPLPTPTPKTPPLPLPTPPPMPPPALLLLLLPLRFCHRRSQLLLALLRYRRRRAYLFAIDDNKSKTLFPPLLPPSPLQNKNLFLDASTHLYKRVCLTVRRSIGLAVGQSVGWWPVFFYFAKMGENSSKWLPIPLQASSFNLLCSFCLSISLSEFFFYNLSFTSFLSQSFFLS